MSLPKVVLFGTTAVGKTALFLRLSDNLFDQFSRSTVQAASKVIKVDRDGRTVSFVLNDTAGQERFRSLTLQYFRAAAVGVLVFSLASVDSLNDGEATAKGFQSQCPDIALILVGNKSDLEGERQVTQAAAAEVAEKLNAPYVETSALTGEGIQDLLGGIADTLEAAKENARLGPTTVTLEDEVVTPTQKKKGCC
jgi:small GTP-binding protein